jgi:hypothetical protein
VAKPNEPYVLVEVESYVPKNTSRLHGKVHIRPCNGHGYRYPPNRHMECAKERSKNFPVGTRFRLRAKLIDREGVGEFLYRYFGWNYNGPGK